MKNKTVKFQEIEVTFILHVKDWKEAEGIRNKFNKIVLKQHGHSHSIMRVKHKGIIGFLERLFI